MMALHELLNRLPVTARSRDRPGLRIENGLIVDDNYSGPVLEEVLRSNEIRRVVPGSGTYQGTPVVVAPIRDSAGEAIAAVGVVDITGIFELADLMDRHASINREVCGTDTCAAEGPRRGRTP
jgi:hypothetical protein